MTYQQSNYIKLIAIFTMLIDHIGLIFFPDIDLFRIIGRIAFPLFAYQLGVGYTYTRSFKKYFLKIFIFGVAIQLFYVSAFYFFEFGDGLNKLNIFFTLALGLIAIYLYENKKYAWLILLILISGYLRFINIKIDYDIYGIALILLFFAEKNNPLQMTILFAIINFLYCYYLQDGYYIQMYSLLSMLFILKPIPLKLSIPGYAFYLFYPLHLALLYIIKIGILGW